jgi:hypothetical protein
MHNIRGTFYTGPILPINPRRDTHHTTSQRLKGKVVGVRTGRSNETRETRILTIKVLGPAEEIKNLLNAEIDIIVHPPAST